MCTVLKNNLKRVFKLRSKVITYKFRNTKVDVIKMRNAVYFTVYIPFRVRDFVFIASRCVFLIQIL